MIRGYLISLFVILSGTTHASTYYDQILLQLGSPRSAEIRFDASQDTINISLANTTADELGELDLYNEHLVKRLLIRETKNKTTHISIKLKSKDIAATVSEYWQPYRIAVDIYQKDYVQKKHRFIHRIDGKNINSSYANSLSNLQGSIHESELDTGLNGNAMTFNLEETELNQKSLRHKLSPNPTNLPLYIYKLNWSIAGLEGLKPMVDSASNTAQAYDFALKAVKAFDEDEPLVALRLFNEASLKDNSIFSKHPVFLWKYAESNLLNGNPMQAQGYYESLINQFPASEIIDFARIRALDVIVLRQNNGDANNTAYTNELNNILKQSTNREVKTWINIRLAYWNENAKAQSGSIKPFVSPALFDKLLPQKKRSKLALTNFNVDLLLFSHITNIAERWQPSHGEIANEFFATYQGDYFSEILEDAKNDLKQKLVHHFTQLHEQGHPDKVIQSFDTLPGPLQSIRKDQSISNILAESYFILNMYENAISFYIPGSENKEDKWNYLKSNFLIPYMAKKIVKSKITPSFKKFNTYARKHDQRAITAIDDANEEMINNFTSTHLQLAIDSVTNEFDNLAPAILVLKEFQKRKNSGQSLEQITDKAPPSANLLNSLIKIFARNKMWRDRRSAMAFLRDIDPNGINDSKVKDAWLKNLYSLADEYRKANNFYQAGTLLQQLAAEDNSGNTSSENYYKSGLLLLKAGRRDEAMQSFKASCEDSNNIYYQNLSCERLALLENN